MIAGSKIIHKNNEIVFTNEGMAPGTVIRSWCSTAKYLDEETSPTLPLIKRFARYRLLVDLNVTPSNSVYFEVVFFNKNANVIKSEIIEGSEGTFLCPENGFSYEIHLVNVNNKLLKFRKILLISEETYKKNIVQVLGENVLLLVDNEITLCKKHGINIKVLHSIGDTQYINENGTGPVRLFIDARNIREKKDLVTMIQQYFEIIRFKLREVLSNDELYKKNIADIIVTDNETIFGVSVGNVVQALLSLGKRNNTILKERLEKYTSDDQSIIESILFNFYAESLFKIN